MKNANTPAMPVLDEIGMPFNQVPDEVCTIGLTKREYFAAMAMQGLCTACDKKGVWSHDAKHAAGAAVAYADALLAELERTNG